jgi:hypothetical protein
MYLCAIIRQYLRNYYNSNFLNNIQTQSLTQIAGNKLLVFDFFEDKV